MQNKAMVAGVVVLILAVGGFMMFKDKEEDVNEELTEETEEQDEVAEGKKMAFADFVRQGGSYECTIDIHMNGMESSGKTYMSDGMMKAEYSTTVQGTTMTSNMIMKDGYMYSWSSAAPKMGFKMKVAEGTTSGPTGTQGSFDFNQIGDYHCDAWTASASTFAIPSTVVFQELKTQ